MTEQSKKQQQSPQTQVWAQLGSEQQAGIVQLVAQLAFKLLITQIETEWQEAGNVADQ